MFPGGGLSGTPHAVSSVPPRRVSVHPSGTPFQLQIKHRPVHSAPGQLGATMDPDGVAGAKDLHDGPVELRVLVVRQADRQGVPAHPHRQGLCGDRGPQLLRHLLHQLRVRRLGPLET